MPGREIWFDFHLKQGFFSSRSKKRHLVSPQDQNKMQTLYSNQSFQRREEVWIMLVDVLLFGEHLLVWNGLYKNTTAITSPAFIIVPKYQKPAILQTATWGWHKNLLSERRSHLSFQPWVLSFAFQISWRHWWHQRWWLRESQAWRSVFHNFWSRFARRRLFCSTAYRKKTTAAFYCFFLVAELPNRRIATLKHTYNLHLYSVACTTTTSALAAYSQ